MGINDNDNYIEMLKYAKNNPKGFKLEGLKKHLHLRKDSKEWDLILKHINHSKVFISDPRSSKFYLSFDDYFRLLNYHELNHARKSSNDANLNAQKAFNIMILVLIATITIEVISWLNYYTRSYCYFGIPVDVIAGFLILGVMIFLMLKMNLVNFSLFKK